MIRFKKLPEDISKKVDYLYELFENDPNIIFAYLFGGLLRERRNPLSDIDIAIFIKDEKRLDYLDLFSKITDILGTDELDLVVLNNSPISLIGRILKNRRVLIDKNPFLRHRYESINLRKYFDFERKEMDIIKRRYIKNRYWNCSINITQEFR